MIKEILYKWFGIESPPCESCEVLKMQLAIANHEKEQMLNAILSFTRSIETDVSVPVAVNYKEIKPKMITWNVRRQMLEAEDRNAAQILARKKKKSEAEKIAGLEKEVGIEEEVKEDA